MSVNIHSKGTLIPVTGVSFSTQSTYDDTELREKIEGLTTALKTVVDYIGEIPKTSDATTVVEYIQQVETEAEASAESKIAGSPTKPESQVPGDVWIETT